MFRRGILAHPPLSIPSLLADMQSCCLAGNQSRNGGRRKCDRPATSFGRHGRGLRIVVVATLPLIATLTAFPFSCGRLLFRPASIRMPNVHVFASIRTERPRDIMAHALGPPAKAVLTGC